MFDRRSHLLDSLRTLANYMGPGDTGTEPRPYNVLKNLAHQYSVYLRLFPDHLDQIERSSLDELFDMVKELEAPIWEAKGPAKCLKGNVKTGKHWKNMRKLASQGFVAAQGLPRLRERPVKSLRLPVGHFTAERVGNPPDPKDLEELSDGVCQNDVNWLGLQEDLLNTLEKHGLTGPDDPADQPQFYLVDDRYNDERYHYVEVFDGTVLTLNWLRDMVNTLKAYHGWGVGMNLGQGYWLVFADRLLVKGNAFRRCKDAVSAVGAAQKAVRWPS